MLFRSEIERLEKLNQKVDQDYENGSAQSKVGRFNSQSHGQNGRKVAGSKNDLLDADEIINGAKGTGQGTLSNGSQAGKGPYGQRKLKNGSYR